jgi:NAD(P)-dependent dehydrogenase (short-subunit alcohol dehydrogenase family)
MTWNTSDIPDQQGRTALVTGANTGIGFAAAQALAAKGARVLLGCRSLERAEQAVERIRAEVADADLAVVQLDLSSLEAIARAAARVEQEPHLDLLINNAGIMAPPRQETVDGFESQIGVNHLGHFALTGQLLGMLRDRPGARIVTVSSKAHEWGEIDFEDLQAEQGYSRMRQYGASKLANLLFTYELQRRLEEADGAAIALACHPGVSGTDLGRDLPRTLELAAPLLRLLAQSSERGALPTLRAATDPEAQGGEYYGPAYLNETMGPPRRVRSNRRSQDPMVASRLWDVSVELTGVDPEI